MEEFDWVFLFWDFVVGECVLEGGFDCFVVEFGVWGFFWFFEVFV